MNIAIPVSSFSKKIIVKQFGEKSPVVVEVGTPFYANLFVRSRGNAAITLALEVELSHFVVFDLPDNPLFQTHAMRLRVGDYINTYHRRELNNYIKKRDAAGCTNIQAVEEFCKAHGILLEEDITFDAIIRDYRRKKNKYFIQKNTDFLDTERIVRGRKNGNILHSEIPDFSAFTDAELDTIIDKYIETNKAYFQRKRDGKELKYMKLKLQAFVYRRCAHQTMKQCLKKLGLQPQQRVLVWKYAQSFHNYLPFLPQLNA
jgi:hypothetical protein